jgi:hypothetical protein
MTKSLQSSIGGALFLGLILAGGSGCGAFRLSRCSWPLRASCTAPSAPTRCGRTAAAAIAAAPRPPSTARIAAAGLRAAWEDLGEFDHVLREDTDIRAPLGASSSYGGTGSRRAAAVSLGSSRDPRQHPRGSSRVVLVASSSSFLYALVL